MATHQLLVCVDNSSFSDVAFEKALTLALQHPEDTVLHILTVFVPIKQYAKTHAFRDLNAQAMERQKMSLGKYVSKCALVGVQHHAIIGKGECL
jgi:hypothetical protein